MGSHLKDIYKLDELTEDLLTFRSSIAKNIICNYDQSQWLKASEDVVKNQKVENNQEFANKIAEICEEFEVDDLLGACIMHSEYNKQL